MIEFNVSQIERAEKLLSGIPGALPKAQASAINRSLTAARTEVVRSVRNEYIIQAGDVRKNIKLTNATAGNPVGILKSENRPIPLIQFEVTRGNPVLAKVKKRSAAKPIKSAFIQTVKSGHTGVYVRSGKARYPIKQLYGPSIPQMVGNETVIKRVEDKAISTLDKRIEHEIARMLEG